MEHMGNYVIDRVTGRKIFEAMPLCMSPPQPDNKYLVNTDSYTDYDRCPSRHAPPLRLRGKPPASDENAEHIADD